MNGPGLAAWLVLSAALFCLGALAAVLRRDRGGVAAGVLLTLAAAAVALAAFVRFAVLPVDALATLLVLLVAGGVFLLVLENLGARKEEP